MSKLPPGWQVKRLGDCLEKLKSGKLAERGWSPQCLSNPAPNNDSWGVLKTTAVQMGSYEPQYNKELPSSLEPKTGLEVNVGDFLITTTGPRNRCGVVCLVRATPKRLIFSGKILRFRTDEEIVLAKWLMYLLMSPDYQEILDRMKVGSSDSSVSIGNKQVLDLEILVPPIREQFIIVEILETQLSHLDSGINGLQVSKLKSQKLRRALLNNVFNGNFSANAATWNLRKISDLAEINPRKPELSSDTQCTLLPMASVAEVTGALLINDTIKFDEGKRRNLTFMQDDDVIFAKITPCMENGKIALVRNLVNGIGFGSTEFHVLRTGPELLSEYLWYFLVSDDYRAVAQRAMTGAVGQQRVPKAFLAETEILVPPISEQRRLIHLIRENLVVTDNFSEQIDGQLKRSSSLRRALLQAAFTGQLNKEPANV